MSCTCRCHAYGPGSYITCDVDRHSSGVPTLKSCSPCPVDEPVAAADPVSGWDCISGCMTRPKGQEPAKPRQATRGNLCLGCFRRLEDWLRDIPVDFALLPMLFSSGGSQRMDGTSRTKQAEAPAPLRLDVAALADKPRPARVALPDRGNPVHETTPRQGYSGVRAEGDELWYELPDIALVLSTLHTWAEDLRCELDTHRDRTELDDTHTVVGEAGYLLRAIDRLSEADWVDEAMTELRTVWLALCRVHGLTVGKSLGDCFSVPCEGRVYRDRFTGIPSCNVCHREYIGLDALRLKLTEEHAS